MDFLYFDPKFGVIICTRCKYALAPGTIGTHLLNIHKGEVTQSERRDCVEIWATKPIKPALVVKQLDVPIDTPPIPYLTLHYGGITCRLCRELAYGKILLTDSPQRKLRLLANFSMKGPMSSDITRGMSPQPNQIALLLS